MRKTKKLYSGGFYLLESRSVANSVYFRNRKECKLFHNFVDRWLGGIIRVYDFVLAEDGWLMVVKIRDKEIINSYIKRHYAKHRFMEEWELVSEQVRLMLSAYVVRVNKMRGRSGTLVHSSYERFYFQKLGEAKMMLNKIRNQAISRKQGRKRYRAKRKQYVRLIRMGKGHILLSSLSRGKSEVGAGKRMKCFIDRPLSNMVVVKLIDSTNLRHIFNHPPP